MNFVYGVDGEGNYITEPGRDERQVAPDPANFDTTDFPRKGCRQCGKRDRPQYKGICNDDHCSNP